ncbi:TPA: hypothetical protein M5604_000229 [Staphylococcus aureus]|nr:hypothetical protein [Staphylococcus aureus]
MTVVLDFLYYPLSNQQLASNKTITNQKHNQYHNPPRVDYGAPTCRISKRNSTDNASWAEAPTWKLTKKSAYYNVQVGVGPNMENFEKKFYRLCKLGWGPNMEADEKVNFQYQ